MLKNKNYLYGNPHLGSLPSHGHFGKYMLHRISQFGDKDAIIHSETGDRTTFKELAQRIVDIALSLSKLGVRKGQTVGICSEKQRDFLPTVLGIICTGATFSPADITCGRATILHRINLAKPRIMFCSESGYATHKESLATVDSLQKIILFSDKHQEGTTLFKDFLTETAKVEDFETEPVESWGDICMLLYSSGTTGLPKGIPKTHKAYIGHMENYMENKFIARNSMLITREWYYSYGLQHSMLCLHDGTTIVWSDRNQVEDMLAAIQNYKVICMQVAPATVTEIVKFPNIERFDLSSLEYIVSASTTMQKDLIKAVTEKFPKLKMVTQILGMSEAGAVCTDLLSKVGPKPGSVGVPNAGVTLKILDLETRQPCGPHQRGELCIRSPYLMKRYVGDTSYDYYDEEGFFMTGDVGYYDEDSHVFMVDRIKELIKFNSFQVAPAELEAVLLQHSDVKDAGVVGAPHPKWGEAPTAFVVLQPGATITEDELSKYMDEQVSFRMRLAGGVRFVDKLPYGGGNKLDRKTLRQWISNRHNQLSARIMSGGQ